MDDLGPIAVPTGQLTAVLSTSVAAGLSAFTILFGVRWLIGRRRLKLEGRTSETLSDRLQRLASTAQALRDLARDVTAEADAQAKVAEVAAAEAKRNQTLATLSAEQAKAVNEVFEASGEKQQRALTKSTVVWAVISLIVSNAVSVAVALWIAGLTR